VGDEVLTRVAGSGDLSLDTAVAEPARDHDAVELTQTAFGEQTFGVVGRDPVDLDLRSACVTAVLERLDHGEVRIGEVDVLADEPDAHRLRRGFHTRHELAP